VDDLKEEIGEQRLEFEDDVEAGVLGFCLFEAADNEDGQLGADLAELMDELGSTHAGHDVIGDDEADLFGEFALLKLFEGADGVEGRNDEISGALEDSLACRGLDRVVV